MSIPFFSICISSLNRESTIAGTLKSVSRQTCDDFELIIVDCGSQDKTVAQIEHTLRETWFSQNASRIRCESIPIKVRTVEDWNEPLKLATGRYILMLEGDDEIREGFLAAAKTVLEQNDNIGIYATGNQSSKRKRTGWFKSEQYKNYIYSLFEVPPPSETIFTRTNKLEEPYFYNVEEFSYCPEFDLYIQIARDGFDGFHDAEQYVIRAPSTNRKKSIGTKFYNDYFVIMRKYSDEMESRSNKALLRNIHKKLTFYSIKDMLQEKRITAFSKWSIGKMGFGTFISTACILLLKGERK